MSKYMMAPPPALGSGAIEGRYEIRTPSVARPWYSDQTNMTILAVIAIGLILFAAHVFG